MVKIQQLGRIKYIWPHLWYPQRGENENGPLAGWVINGPDQSRVHKLNDLQYWIRWMYGDILSIAFSVLQYFSLMFTFPMSNLLDVWGHLFHWNEPFFCPVKKQLIKHAMFNILLDFIFHHSILLQVKQLMKHVTFIVILYSYTLVNKQIMNKCPLNFLHL